MTDNNKLLKHAEDASALRESHTELYAALMSPKLSSIMEICDMFCDEYGDASMRETFNEFAAIRFEARRNAEKLSGKNSASTTDHGNTKRQLQRGSQ